MADDRHFRETQRARRGRALAANATNALAPSLLNHEELDHARIKCKGIRANLHSNNQNNLLQLTYLHLLVISVVPMA